MMTKKEPARLGKCNAHEILEAQMTITGKQVILITIFLIIFLVFAFISVPQTYGFF